MIRHRSYARRVQIGPAEAATWLSSSRARQRPVDEGGVAQLAEQIRSGRWRASSIVVGGDGLLDGQHRMIAILETGAAVEVKLVSVFNARMRCVECPESCHFGGRRSRSKPRMIAARTFQPRSRGQRWSR